MHPNGRVRTTGLHTLIILLLTIFCDPIFRRVSIVDYAGNVVLDTYVRPTSVLTSNMLLSIS